MPEPHLTVTPQPDDALAIRVNRAEILYERGFGRRYLLWGSFRLFQSAGTAAAAILPLITRLTQKNKPLLTQSLKIAVKGLVFGLGQLVLSFVADPIKLFLEAYEKRHHPEGRTALLVTDVQNDFSKQGTQVIDGKEYHYGAGKLGVDEGYAVVPIINKLMLSLKPGSLIVASLDWHPQQHRSFALNTPGTHPFETIHLVDSDQILWPDHCVQGSTGTQYLPGLLSHLIQYTVKKGMDLFVDSYSVFFDNSGKNPTNLHEYLQGKNVKRLIITGIATDFCVKFSALDAKKLGYDVTVVEDACRGVNLNHSVEQSLNEMKRQGIHITHSSAKLNE